MFSNMRLVPILHLAVVRLLLTELHILNSTITSDVQIFLLLLQIPCNILPADESDDPPGGAGGGELHLVASGVYLHPMGCGIHPESLHDTGTYLHDMSTSLGE